MWCGAHQIDIVIQHAMNSVMKENSFNVMTAFISLVSRQFLSASMEWTCARVVNRWPSSGKVIRLFKQKRPELLQYFTEKNPATAASDPRWMYLLSSVAFTSHSAETFCKIQGLTNLVLQQDAELEQLIDSYTDEVGAIGPLTDGTVAAHFFFIYVVSGHDAISMDNFREFVFRLAS